MGKPCIYCNKNIGFLDIESRCNHGKGLLQDHSQDHIAHSKCCMRANTITLSKEEQDQCKHDYVNLADTPTFSWTLLKTTYKCKKCGYENEIKNPF